MSTHISNYQELLLAIKQSAIKYNNRRKKRGSLPGEFSFGRFFSSTGIVRGNNVVRYCEQLENDEELNPKEVLQLALAIFTSSSKGLSALIVEELFKPKQPNKKLWLIDNVDELQSNIFNMELNEELPPLRLITASEGGAWFGLDIINLAKHYLLQEATVLYGQQEGYGNPKRAIFDLKVTELKKLLENEYNLVNGPTTSNRKTNSFSL